MHGNTKIGDEASQGMGDRATRVPLRFDGTRRFASIRPGTPCRDPAPRARRHRPRAQRRRFRAPSPQWHAVCWETVMPKSRPPRAPRASYSDPISNYLVERPYSVASLATLRHAAGRMAAYGIRHLPVMEGERVAGLVRESELHILERWGDVPFDTTTVAEVMCFDVHFVHPSSTLGTVIRDMRRGRFDHTMVLDRERLVGIFTITDALALLANELGTTLDEGARTSEVG